MGVRYGQIFDGDKIVPIMRGWKLACCDCGLVHVVDLKVIKRGKRNKVELRFRKDARATAATRKNKALLFKRKGAKLRRGTL